MTKQEQAIQAAIARGRVQLAQLREQQRLEEAAHAFDYAAARAVDQALWLAAGYASVPEILRPYFDPLARQLTVPGCVTIAARPRTRYDRQLDMSLPTQWYFDVKRPWLNAGAFTEWGDEPGYYHEPAVVEWHEGLTFTTADVELMLAYAAEKLAQHAALSAERDALEAERDQLQAAAERAAAQARAA